MSDQDSERGLLRDELTKANRELMISLQHRIDRLEEDVRRELLTMDAEIVTKIMQAELRIADLAVAKAVHLAFSHLGVDVGNPHDMQVFRDDLRFGGVFRNAFGKSMFAFAAAIFGGLGLSFWLAIKDYWKAP